MRQMMLVTVVHFFRRNRRFNVFIVIASLCHTTSHLILNLLFLCLFGFFFLLPSCFFLGCPSLLCFFLAFLFLLSFLSFFAHGVLDDVFLFFFFLFLLYGLL